MSCKVRKELRIDPWEYQYVKYRPEYKDVVLDDVSAYEYYSDLRWVYDKKHIDTKYNELILEPPSSFITKPRINFDGLGRGFSSGKSTAPLGHIKQRRASGRYLSTDFKISSGEIVNQWAFAARPSPPNNKFDVFYLTDEDVLRNVNVVHLLSDITEKMGDGYVNVETMGGVILEAHLRPSLQFADLTFLSVKELPALGGFSVVFHSKKDLKLPFPEDESTLPYLESVLSVQYCWEPGRALSCSYPNKPHKVLVVNGTDFKECVYYGNIILSRLKTRR